MKCQCKCCSQKLNAYFSKCKCFKIGGERGAFITKTFVKKISVYQNVVARSVKRRKPVASKIGTFDDRLVL